MKEQKVGTIAHIGAGKVGLTAALDLIMTKHPELHVIQIEYQKPEPIPFMCKVEPFRGKVRKKRRNMR